MFEKVKEYYAAIKFETAKAVLWAESNLKGKTGEEKKKAVTDSVVNFADSLIKLPVFLEWADGPAIRFIVSPLIDKFCELLNICADGDFTDVKVNPADLAAAAGVPANTAMSVKKRVIPAADYTPEGMEHILIDGDRQALIDARFDTLVQRVKYPAPSRESAFWDKSIKFVLAREGGYANHPADKGGETNMGITAGTLANAYAQGVVGHNVVSKLTKEEAISIYKKNYWDNYGFDTIPWPGCLLLFDSAVNHGGSGMARIAQNTLNAVGIPVASDGKWGPETKGALQTAARKDAFSDTFLQKRQEYYDAIAAKNPSQKVFMKGWQNRLAALREEISKPIKEE
jgi:lysozyme family protein